MLHEYRGREFFSFSYPLIFFLSSMFSMDMQICINVLTLGKDICNIYTSFESVCVFVICSRHTPVGVYAVKIMFLTIITSKLSTTTMIFFIPFHSTTKCKRRQNFHGVQKDLFFEFFITVCFYAGISTKKILSRHKK